MNGVAKFLDKVFSWLPFNGDKLKIGSLLILVSQIHAMFPGFDVLAFLDSRLLVLGVPAFLIGIIHNFVKKQLLQTAPEQLSVSSAKDMAIPDTSRAGLPIAVVPAKRTA